MKNNHIKLNAGVFIAIVLGGSVLYFVPLQSSSFYFDDHYSVESNDAIRKIDIPKIFNAFNTRFLVGLSFALNYKWCVLHPAGYRLINFFIHGLNAFLVYLLIKLTLCSYPKGKSPFFCRPEWPAFFGSMLFLCHPIQTEPVNFITQRFVLMGSFFYLLTLILYIQYRCRSQKRYLIASMISAVAAMFCKEFVVTLPIMITLYDLYFLQSETVWKRCKNLLPFFIIVLIVPFLLLRTPPQAIGVANIADSHVVQESDSPGMGSHIDLTRAHGGIGRKEYFLTELNVVCTYVRLLFLPINQNFDYDYPISNQVDGKTALCGAFLLGLLALAAFTYRSNRLISFSILWFFIALSVESSFIPIGHVIAEYRVYLASVGFVFLIMTLIYAGKRDPRQLNMIATVILIGFSIFTFQRNKVWKDEFTLWNDTVEKSPHKARPYYSRGLAYYNHGNLTQAISDYNKAIGIDPGYENAYFNRGFTYAQQDDLDQALFNYNKVIEMDPKDAEAYSNRGIIYEKQGDLIQALSDYNGAIEINPKLAEAYINRGAFYDSQGNLSQAISDYNKAIEIEPGLAKAYNNRGLIYYKQGNDAQALSDYDKAIEIDPGYAEAYNNRGNVYGNQGNPSGAIIDFSKAIEISPNDAQAYSNLAIAYYSENEYGKAWDNVRKAEKLGAVVNPDFLNDLKRASP